MKKFYRILTLLLAVLMLLSVCGCDTQGGGSTPGSDLPSSGDDTPAPTPGNDDPAPGPDADDPAPGNDDPEPGVDPQPPAQAAVYHKNFPRVPEVDNAWAGNGYRYESEVLGATIELPPEWEGVLELREGELWQELRDGEDRAYMVALYLPVNMEYKEGIDPNDPRTGSFVYLFRITKADWEEECTTEGYTIFPDYFTESTPQRIILETDSYVYFMTINYMAVLDYFYEMSEEKAEMHLLAEEIQAALLAGEIEIYENE